MTNKPERVISVRSSIGNLNVSTEHEVDNALEGKSEEPLQLSDHRFTKFGPRRTVSFTIDFSDAGLAIVDTEDEHARLRKHLMKGTKCHSAMYAIPLKVLLELDELMDHQTLLRAGKLVLVDADEKRPVVFLSHQWVSFDGLDEANQNQFRIFQEAIRSLFDGCRVRHSVHMQVFNPGSRSDMQQSLMGDLVNCLVWFDFMLTKI